MYLFQMDILKSKKFSISHSKAQTKEITVLISAKLLIKIPISNVTSHPHNSEVLRRRSS